MDLPDELLGYIFEMTSPDLSFLKGWSLVCKKMRRVTVSTPRLWAHQRISSLMSPAMIDKIVSRSGTLDLRLEVKSPLVPIDAISTYCHRWSAITLVKLKASDFRLFQSLTPSSKLTSLCSLTLIASNSNYQFNDDWRLANLTHLDSYCGLPTGLTASTLTYCSFHFHNVIDIRGLSTFLSSTPFLETLRIDLSYAKSSVLEDDLAELPSLQKFSVQLYQADRGAVMHILRAISMPNVTTLSVEILDGTSIASESLWTVVTGFKHLEILNLKVTCEVYEVEEYDGDPPEEDDSWYLDDLLAFLPDSMKSLSLTIRDIRLRVDCDVPFSAFRFKGLRSVRFEECNRLDVNFFKELATRFKGEKILLDVLDIRECRDINSEECTEEAVKVLFRDAGVLQA